MSSMDKSEVEKNGSPEKSEQESFPFEKIETTERSIKDLAQTLREKMKEKVNLEEMKIKLARLSSQCSELLSPDFFSKNLEASSSDSSKDYASSSNLSCFPPDGIISSKNTQGEITPFPFPKVSGSGEIDNSEISASKLIRNLERVEILDDNLDENDESKWEECPQNYIQQNNYRLGIQPGSFYKNKINSSVWVKLPHRANYKVLVTNNNQLPCHLDLYVNGEPTNALVLRPDETVEINGPIYSKYAFKIFRSNSTPTGITVNEGDLKNGIVKAVFTPKMKGRQRSTSEPLRPKQTLNDLYDMLDGLKEEKKPRSYTTNHENKLERSLDVSQVTEGVILLQGIKKKQRFMPVDELEVDLSKQVVLQLKLVASLVEEVDATDDVIHMIELPEPPPSPQD